MNEQWQRCMDAYLRHVYDRSGSQETVISYRSVLRRIFAQISPEQLTRADIEDFLHQPLSNGKLPAAATRNRWISTLSSFYAFASIYGVFPHASPALGIRRSKVHPVYRAFSTDELARFFAVIPDDTTIGLRDRAIFLTYFYTARRRSEIASLRYGSIEQGILFDPDGSRRTGWIYRFRGKGGMWDRAELPSVAKAAIDRYLLGSGRIVNILPGDPLFLAIGPEQGGGQRSVPGRPLTGIAIWYRLKKYARQAELDAKSLCVHSFRHTSARERYAIKPDVRSVQQALRHANIATTDLYIRELVAVSDPVARLLEEKFGTFG